MDPAKPKALAVPIQSLQSCPTSAATWPSSWKQESFKNVMRSAHTSSGRRESTAEHSWRLCLLAMTLEDILGPLDFERMLKLCVIHDLGEAINGDVSEPCCGGFGTEGCPGKARFPETDRDPAGVTAGRVSVALGMTMSTPGRTRLASSRHWTRLRPSFNTIRARTRR